MSEPSASIGPLESLALITPWREGWPRYRVWIDFFHPSSIGDPNGVRYSREYFVYAENEEALRVMVETHAKHIEPEYEFTVLKVEEIQ